MNQHTANNLPEDPIQKEIEKLDATTRKQEERVRNLEARAGQNVNLYFVFQAVILTSTTMASAPKCHQWWIPFIVSLLAAVVNFFTFCSAMFKVLRSREELDQNLADVSFIQLNRMTRAQVSRVLPGTTLNQQGNEIVKPKASSLQRWKRRLLVYSYMALFLGFTAVIMSGSYTILCRSSDGKCVKLC